MSDASVTKSNMLSTSLNKSLPSSDHKWNIMRNYCNMFFGDMCTVFKCVCGGGLCLPFFYSSCLSLQNKQDKT